MPSICPGICALNFQGYLGEHKAQTQTSLHTELLSTLNHAGKNNKVLK